MDRGARWCRVGGEGGAGWSAICSPGAPGGFGGTIAEFATNNSVDLLKTPATSETFAGGVLTVKDGSTVVANLHFAGSYTSSSFALASNGHGGTFIHFV